jgi:hypothetical protein
MPHDDSAGACRLNRYTTAEHGDNRFGDGDQPERDPERGEFFSKPFTTSTISPTTCFVQTISRGLG